MTLNYLATVYTKHPKGIEKAFEEAAGLVARLLRRGIISYDDKSEWPVMDEQAVA